MWLNDPRVSRSFQNRLFLTRTLRPPSQSPVMAIRRNHNLDVVLVVQLLLNLNLFLVGSVHQNLVRTLIPGVCSLLIPWFINCDNNSQDPVNLVNLLLNWVNGQHPKSPWLRFYRFFNLGCQSHNVLAVPQGIGWLPFLQFPHPINLSNGYGKNVGCRRWFMRLVYWF